MNTSIHITVDLGIFDPTEGLLLTPLNKRNLELPKGAIIKVQSCTIAGQKLNKTNLEFELTEPFNRDNYFKWERKFKAKLIGEQNEC